MNKESWMSSRRFSAKVRDISKQKLKRHQTTELCQKNRLNLYRVTEETDLSSEAEEEVGRKGWFKED